MKRSLKLRWLTILCVVSVFANAQPGWADQPVAGITPLFRDIALADGGTLSGQVLDSSGIPQANVSVAIQRFDQVVQQVVTDQDGIFVVEGLTGGMYQITVGNDAYLYRAWAPNTAPPSSGKYALVVSNQPVVRSQWWNCCRRGGFWGNLFRSPYFWGGAAIAGIAIPLAIDAS
jgi:hypothetical protein